MSGFWKPGGGGGNAIDDISIFRDDNDEGANNDEKTSNYVFNFKNSSSRGGGGGASSSSLTQQRMLLPIYKHRKQILYAIEKYHIVIIVGETGCGKSTQIPQYLYENGWAGNGDENDDYGDNNDNNDDDDDDDFYYYQIVCTQPRRIAAQTLARRVSNEVGISELGEDVGYTVRFDDCTTAATTSATATTSSSSRIKRRRRTKIKYVTDGILIREAITHDPLLSKYSVIMIDEAHERSINTDILLGILKKIRIQRPSLRIIICSATINANEFLNYFINDNDNNKVAVITEEQQQLKKKKKKSRWGASSNSGSTHDSQQPQQLNNNDDDDDIAAVGTIISVDGRQYPVDALYLKEPCSNYIRQTIETVFSIHNKLVQETSGSGDILCFLPSSNDIDNAIQLAEEHEEQESEHYQQRQNQQQKHNNNNNKSRNRRRRQLVFLPLYGNLPYKMQALVFQPKTITEQRTTRRVIFATNIAETSVTVPDITYVIDCGFVKLPYFDCKTGFDRLIITPISRTSSIQRCGRAGRITNGVCYRLYTEDYYLTKMINETPCEISRTNLTQFVLIMKSLGVHNILNFDLLTIPSISSLEHGLETLYALGAIDDQTNLTPKGYNMSSFAVEPRISCVLLESLTLGCSWEVCGVAAVLQVRSLFLSPRTSRQKLDYDTAIQDFADASGDHVTYANLIADYDNGLLDDADECKEMFINYIALKRAIEVRDQLVKFLKRFGRIKAVGLTSSSINKKKSSSSSRHGNRSSRDSGHHFHHQYQYHDINGNENENDNDDERSKCIRKCITTGFFFNTAKIGNDGRYYTIRGNHLVIPHPSSILCQSSNLGNYSEYIVFGETTDASSSSGLSVSTSSNKGGSGGGGSSSVIEIKSCSTISAKWLYEIAPHYWE